jgi:isocitrate dehydrogenase (NAD+)
VSPDVGQTITLIPRDGIGPEISAAVIVILEAAGFRPTWETVLAGDSAIRDSGSPLPDKVIESISENRIGLKEPVRTPIGSGYKSVNVALR